jgi:ubiquinone/menaquinone biosynthesis C-methylase UbiE
MELLPGMAVADIGAGTGYFALPIAKAVGPTGRVAAVDVSPEMLSILNEKILGAEILNIECIQGEADATGLAPGGFDRVLLANIWHEVDDRPATLAEAARLLQSDGRITILDWSPEGPLTEVPAPGPPMEHRIPLAAVWEELVEHGWSVLQAGPMGEYSWMVIAETPKA